MATKESETGRSDPQSTWNEKKKERRRGATTLRYTMCRVLICVLCDGQPQEKKPSCRRNVRVARQFNTQPQHGAEAFDFSTGFHTICFQKTLLVFASFFTLQQAICPHVFELRFQFQISANTMTLKGFPTTGFVSHSSKHGA